MGQLHDRITTGSFTSGSDLFGSNRARDTRRSQATAGGGRGGAVFNRFPAWGLDAGAAAAYHPAKGLIAAVEIDLPGAPPTEALMLPSMLQKTGPVSFFAPEMPPDKALQRENNGSELLLLDAAQELPHVLEEPIRT